MYKLTVLEKPEDFFVNTDADESEMYGSFEEATARARKFARQHPGTFITVDVVSQVYAVKYARENGKLVVAFEDSAGAP